MFNLIRNHVLFDNRENLTVFASELMQNIAWTEGVRNTMTDNLAREL